MSNRLNQEREQKLQPIRMKKAKEEIGNLGLTIVEEDGVMFKFIYNGNVITYFPYSGWHTGKGIKDGRGFRKLLNQLK